LEIDTVPLGNGSQLEVREVGAPMTPIWPKFASEADLLVFVVDLTEPALLAAS